MKTQLDDIIFKISECDGEECRPMLTIEAKDNVIIGHGAAPNMTTASNCFIWGKGAGADVKDQDYQIRIGDGAERGADDMVVIGDNVVISKEAFKKLNPEWADAIIKKFS